MRKAILHYGEFRLWWALNGAVVLAQPRSVTSVVLLFVISYLHTGR